MTKIYTKISETEVDVTEVIEQQNTNVVTVEMINGFISSLDSELERINNKKLELQAEIAIIQETLATVEPTEPE